MIGVRGRRFVWGCIAVAAVSLAAADEERVGNDTCAVCHEEVVSAFRSSVHWKANPEGACEGCHGSGVAHVDDPSPQTIRALKTESGPATIVDVCLACHGETRRLAGFTHGEHGRAAVACTACHAPHEAARRATLLREKTPGLCYRCHPSIRAEFSLNERHPVDRGAVTCQDCHDPHGRSDRRTLGGFKQEACLGCHAEYRGPWIFEHEAVAVEGCTSCHVPHGSVNRHLLLFQRAGDVCLQCHPEQPFFHDLTEGPGTAPRNTGINDCTRCHARIHGSNNDALFLN